LHCVFAWNTSEHIFHIYNEGNLMPKLGMLFTYSLGALTVLKLRTVINEGSK